jgi:hypothetical protein
VGRGSISVDMEYLRGIKNISGGRELLRDGGSTFLSDGGCIPVTGKYLSDVGSISVTKGVSL